MDIRTQSDLLASIVGLALGVSMLLRAERSRVTNLYAAFALTVGGFYLAHFFEHLFVASTGYALQRISHGGMLILGALVPSAALGFFLEFLGVSPRSGRNGRRVALLSAVFGLAVGVTPLANNLWAKVALAVWVFGALSVSVWLLVARARQHESRIERVRLNYLALGAGAALLFAALDLLPRFDVPFPPLGAAVTTLYLFFLAQTLLRLRLMDLHELLGKIASQTILALVLALVFSALTVWVQGNTSLFLFNTVVATFVVMILQEPLRPKLEERVIAIFFRERYELLRALANLRARMANVIEVSELATLVLAAFHETRRVTHASIYLLADDRPGYRLLDHRGPQPASFLDSAAARGLLAAVAGGQKAVLLENVDRRIEEARAQLTDGGKRMRDELKRLTEQRAALVQVKAGICVPLVGNDRVIGFLNLWDERVPEAYASDEIAQILEIGERVATVVENSKIYDKMRERDRLAALGEMAAGLAHEIRNPLGAIKGAAQFLEPKKLPGEEGEFLEVIVEEVNRLNGVVSAFLDYSRPLKQSFGPTDLNEVVTRTVKLIHNDLPPRIEVKLELAEALNKTNGDAEQLKQVLINLVQNAVQAIGQASGKITMKTLKPERFGDFRGADVIELHVSDSGPGIPHEKQQSIFIPFYTTKEKGTGLGLAICQRIIKSHGGGISVTSRPGEGATFIIRLPAVPNESQLETLSLTEPAPAGTPLPGALQRPPDLDATQRESPLAKEDPKASRKERRKRQAG
ncbi:MAG TPA: ATP-binding protein [Myxococcaceae bacterium]|nr:ATP-binding protein [Myxococcaceae bacterium]